MTIDRKAETLRRVLFLGEENFHASRFCEELFNSYARTEGLNWQAASRGLHRAPASRHLEPMSPQAVECLRRLGAAPVNHTRLPLEATDFDLRMSDSVIALGLRDGRGRLHARWPDYASQVELWSLPAGTGDDALRVLAAEMRVLLASLSGQRRHRHRQPGMSPPAAVLGGF